VAQAKSRRGRRARGLRRRRSASPQETEQSLATYGAELDRRQALATQTSALKSVRSGHDQFVAGSSTYLDLLITEQSLVAADAAVAGLRLPLAQDQVAVSKRSAAGGAGRDVFAVAHHLVSSTTISAVTRETNTVVTMPRCRLYALVPQIHAPRPGVQTNRPVSTRKRHGNGSIASLRRVT